MGLYVKPLGNHCLIQWWFDIDLTWLDDDCCHLLTVDSDICTSLVLAGWVSLECVTSTHSSPLMTYPPTWRYIANTKGITPYTPHTYVYIRVYGAVHRNIREIPNWLKKQSTGCWWSNNNNSNSNSNSNNTSNNRCHCLFVLYSLGLCNIKDLRKKTNDTGCKNWKIADCWF